MTQTDTFQQTCAHSAPPRLSRLAASTAIHAAVIEAADAARTFDRDERKRPPRFVIRAEAGAGKTRAAIAELKKDRWKGKRVLYALPSLALADELAREMREAGINALVIRGRTAPDPDASRIASNPVNMCLKPPELLETLTARAENITATLCRKRLDNGAWLECPFASQCGYMKQAKEAKAGPAVLIGSHAYLWQRVEILNEDKIDFVIIDEDFAGYAAREGNADFHRFLDPSRGVGENGYRSKDSDPEERRRKNTDLEAKRREDEKDFRQILAALTPALRVAFTERRQPTIAELKAHGLTAERAERAAQYEYSHLASLDIHPELPTKRQLEIAKAAAGDREAFAFANLWKAVATALWRERRDGTPDRLLVARDVLRKGRNGEDDRLRDELQYFVLKPPHYQGVPLLILDAHADEELVGRLYPGAQYTDIRAEWRNVTVHQCTDASGSKSAFANSQSRRDDLLNLAQEMNRTLADPQDDSTKPLLVTLMDNERTWIEERKAHQWEDGRIFASDASAEIAHFGALRGRDLWKNCSALIIGGRIEPSTQALERLGRAWFGDEPEPLACVVADEKGFARLPRRQVELTTRDGHRHTTEASYHPDPRIHRILWSVREAELEQAIARARLVHRSADRPCVVTILSNLPLDIPVDDFRPWRDLAPDGFRVAAVRGFLPTKHGELSTAHPDLFPSAEAARKAAARRAARFGEGASKTGQESIKYLIENCPAFAGGIWTQVRYHREGNRKTSTCFIRLLDGDDETALKSRVEAFLGPLESFDVIGDLPAAGAVEEAFTAVADGLAEKEAEAATVADRIWLLVGTVEARRRTALEAAKGPLAHLRRQAERDADPPDRRADL